MTPVRSSRPSGSATPASAAVILSVMSARPKSAPLYWETTGKELPKTHAGTCIICKKERTKKLFCAMPAEGLLEKCSDI